MFVLIAYDVPSERTECYRKLLARYLPPAQNSVFHGDITGAKFLKLANELKKIRLEQDSIIVVSTENRRNVVVEEICRGKTTLSTAHLGTAIF